MSKKIKSTDHVVPAQPGTTLLAFYRRGQATRWDSEPVIAWRVAIVRDPEWDQDEEGDGGGAYALPVAPSRTRLPSVWCVCIQSTNDDHRTIYFPQEGRHCRDVNEAIEFGSKLLKKEEDLRAERLRRQKERREAASGENA